MNFQMPMNQQHSRLSAIQSVGSPSDLTMTMKSKQLMMAELASTGKVIAKVEANKVHPKSAAPQKPTQNNDNSTHEAVVESSIASPDEPNDLARADGPILVQDDDQVAEKRMGANMISEVINGDGGGSNSFMLEKDSDISSFIGA